MRKAILFVLLGMLAAGAARAEKLVIRLESGNAIVVRYEGTIQGVELQGKSDTIAGIDLPVAAREPIDDRQVAVAEKPEPRHQPAKEKAADPAGHRWGLRWADPIDETR